MTSQSTISDVVAKLDQLIERSGERWPRWLDVETAAGYASLSSASIRRLLSGGKLRAHRPVRGRILIDRIELDALISASNGVHRNGRGAWKRNGRSQKQPH